MADLLKQTAELLNQNAKLKKEENEEILQLVSFTIGKGEFAVDILIVQEIIRFIQCTKVPNAPKYVDGVINLRGKVIPVVNLRYKLGMQRKEADQNSRIIVVETNGVIIGFLVDAVKEVLRIPVSITEAPPPMISGVSSEYISSVGKLKDRLLILLNTNKVLENVKL